MADIKEPKDRPSHIISTGHLTHAVINGYICGYIGIASGTLKTGDIHLPYEVDRDVLIVWHEGASMGFLHSHSEPCLN